MNYVETSLDLFFNSQTGPAPVQGIVARWFLAELWFGLFDKRDSRERHFRFWPINE